VDDILKEAERSFMEKPNTTNTVNYSVPSAQDLFKAGFHFGHTKSKWYPKMGEYIYTTKDGVHIIDINKTVSMFSPFLEELSRRAKTGSVLVVGTKKQATNAVKTLSLMYGMHYISNRWPGGTLTNFDLVRDGIKKMMSLEEEYYKGMLDRTKKERIEVKKILDRKMFLFGGVLFMDKLPKAVIVIDSLVERSVINEAKAMSVPVFGMCDTNCNPDVFDYFIPGNDDATKSVEIFLHTIGQVIKDTTSARDIKAQIERRAALLAQFESEANEVKKQKEAERELKAQKMRAMKDENLAKKLSLSKIKQVKIVEDDVSEDAEIGEEAEKIIKKEVSTKKTVEEKVVEKKVVEKKAVEKKVKPKATKKVVKKVEKKVKAITLKNIGLSDKELSLLKVGKVKTVEDVKKLGKEGLIEIKGVGEKMAEKIISAVSKIK